MVNFKITGYTICCLLGFFIFAPTEIWAHSNRAPECLMSCKGQPNGFYRACTKCVDFVACSDEAFLLLHCPSETETGDVIELCSQTAIETCEKTIVQTEEFATEDNYTRNRSVTLYKLLTNKTKELDHKERNDEEGKRNSVVGKHWLETEGSDDTKEIDISKLHNVGYTKESAEAMNSEDIANELKALLSKDDFGKSRDTENAAHQQSANQAKLNIKLKDKLTGNKYSIVPDNEKNKFRGEQTIRHYLQYISEYEPQIPTTPERKRLRDGSSEDVPSRNTSPQVKEIVTQRQTDETFHMINPEEQVRTGYCFIRSGLKITLDRYEYSMTGHSTYVAARDCISKKALVKVKLLEHGSNSSQLQYVDLMIRERRIRLYPIGVAIVDGKVLSPGRSFSDEVLTLVTGTYFSGVETADGITVTLDKQRRFSLFLPASYSGKICGICGSSSGNPRDDAEQVSGAEA